MTYHETISLDIEYEIETDKWGNAYPVIQEVDENPVPIDDNAVFGHMVRRIIYSRLWEDTDMPENIKEYKAMMKDRSVIDVRD
jgi:hypothetical protein